MLGAKIGGPQGAPGLGGRGRVAASADFGEDQHAGVTALLGPAQPGAGIGVLPGDSLAAGTLVPPRPGTVAAPRAKPQARPDVSAPNSAGPRQSDRLRGRLDRWKPQLWPLVIPFLVVVALVSYFASPHAGVLGWPLTILWTWPVINTLIGIRGILRTRRRLQVSRDRWRGENRALCEDFLIVAVPTIGRHDTYPALERSVLSYVKHLPGTFPWLRVDIVTEEGCEAGARIAALAERSPLLRVVTVPRQYRTANGTKFKARANQYVHELRIREYEAGDDVWVLHMDDDTGVGPDTAIAVAQFIREQYQAGPDAKHMAQGILTYPRELAVSRLTWLADAVRPADDIARFAAWTGSGTPRAGVHGELLLLRASVEATIGWDFGLRPAKHRGGRPVRFHLLPALQRPERMVRRAVLRGITGHGPRLHPAAGALVLGADRPGLQPLPAVAEPCLSRILGGLLGIRAASAHRRYSRAGLPAAQPQYFP
jgi:hypothetical protein